jgi:hypothetical protein
MPKIAYLSFARNFLTRFLEPFNTCFSNFTEGCTNPNIHFLLVLTNVGWFLYFIGNRRFSGFAIFNIKKNCLVWSGSIEYFQKTKPANFRAGLNFQRTKTNQFQGRLEFSSSMVPGSMVF